MSFSKFFSILQEAPWYRQFLEPVAQQIAPGSSVLDIGTGTGKLLEMLYLQGGCNCYGLDTNPAMLAEAKKKLGELPVRLELIEAGAKLPYHAEFFDSITICNVLFNLSRKASESILNESLRVLKPGGNLLVLTPTGTGNSLTLSRHYFAPANLGIYLWYHATKSRALWWTQHQYLKAFAEAHTLDYQKKYSLSGFAQVEILQKPFS